MKTSDVYFPILYKVLENYIPTSEETSLLYNVTLDPYIIEGSNRTFISLINGLIKIDNSGLFSSKYHPLNGDEIQSIKEYYDIHKLPKTIVEKNLDPFYEFFDITDDIEKSIFRCSVITSELNSWDFLRSAYMNYIFKKYFGIDQTSFNSVFYKQNNIFSKGILEKKDSSNYGVSDEFKEILKIKNFSIVDIGKLYYNEKLTSTLKIEQFDHLKDDIFHVEKIINSALEEKTKGKNIIFWGIPGTGKTELAILLANKNNWNLISISDSDKDKEGEKTRTQRIQGLVAAQKVFKHKKNTVLLFDEVEDLFKLDFGASQSKLFLNRLIENTEIPIIWTTNVLRVMGQPFLRRMSYNVEFDVPSSGVRSAIWTEYLNIKDESILKNLSREYKLTPASIKVVSDAVNITGVNSYKDIKRIIDKTQKLLNYGTEVSPKKFNDYNNLYYDITAVNASLDLEMMKNQLLKAKPNFALCLYGPSGTGKSEYVKYLASQLGYEILYKRASELTNMYIGETEKAIAAMFKEAKEDGKFILIDEGDTFLRDRSGAQRSWEVSHVNEFLSHMEMLDVPLAITTNLFDSLDPAALRRFTFKVKFDFLTYDQRINLFKKYFEMDAPDYVKKMEVLTPGDFATVKRKIDILNITDESEILKLLDEEISIKPQYNNFKLGFTR